MFCVFYILQTIITYPLLPSFGYIVHGRFHHNHLRHFGASRVSSGAHFHLLYAGSYAVTFVVNAVLVEGQ